MKHEIEHLNEQISYDEGKIYWEPNKGFTSDLIKRLSSLGYQASRTQNGAIHYFRDQEGNLVTSAFTWEKLLFNIARIFT